MKIKNKIYSLKFNSIFKKTLLTLFVLIFVVIILFYYFVNSLYKNNYKEKMIYSSFSMLNAVIIEMDAQILSMEVQMSDLLHDSECTSIAINGKTFQNANALNIALSLFNLTQRSPYADEAWIYIKQSDSIISSDKSIVSRSDFAHNDVLKAYEELKSSSKDTDSSNLLLLDDELFLFQDFPSGKGLSVMCISIDKNALFNLVSDSIQNGTDNIYVYLKGQPIFTKLIHYPSEEKLQITVRNNIDSKKTVCEAADSNSAFILTNKSDSTGLTALVLLNSNDIVPSIQSIFSNMSKFVLFIVMLLLASSIFLVRNIYRPIQRMLLDMLEQISFKKEDEWSTANNELELIQKIYKENRNQKLILGDMLHEVGTAVNERLFYSMLNQEDMNEERVEAILKQIDSPFKIDGEYQVMIFKWSYKKEITFNDVKSGFPKIDFMKICAGYFKNKGHVCCLDDKKDQKILVLNFIHEFSTTKSKHMIQEFVERIEKEYNNSSIQLEVGIGRVYKHIFDIALSYKDAKSNLHQRLYIAAGQQEQGKDIVSLYNVQAKRVLEEIMENPDLGLEQLQQVIKSAEEFPGSAPRVYISIMDLILEKLSNLKIDIDDMWLLQRKQLEADLSPLKENDEREKIMISFHEGTTQAISNYVSKEQFRHIENAKKYIDLHYSDSSLSLNTVSDVCGISSSYLSRIFVTYLPSGFVEYLNKYRIEQAKKLMLATNYTVAEIGFMTGFNSPQNFIRVFKKYQGETPGQFRARCSMGKDNLIDGIEME
ncbi:MAG: AraC family transcriptional regulator [Sedimentibacter sp.]|uniref:AraC family transcriptional regulator n=1 Tax=Sedimentibacter sp. TaxID=1960295 RepID=UPI00315986E3